MPIKGEERRAYHGVCTSTKRPYQGQNNSSFKSDKAAADFLFTCRSCGDSVLSADKKYHRFQYFCHSYGNCDAAVFLSGDV